MNADDMVENIVEIDKDYDFDRSMDTRTKDEKKWTLPKGFIKTYILGNKTMASKLGNKFVEAAKISYERYQQE